MAKILIATEKPFAKVAVEGIKRICIDAGFDFALLEKYSDKSELISEAKDAAAIIIRSDKIDKEIIDSCQNLKIVVRAGAGYDNVDLEAASAKNVVVMNTPGQNSNAVAELAIGMMIYLNRNKYNGTAGTELRGKNLGIHGYGHIGKILAHIGKGLGMKVYAFDPFVDKVVIENDGVICEESVEALYKNCQYISVNIPANEKTKASLNEELMSVMPKGATLVNTARKEIVDEEGLLAVFEKRNDFRYISDIAPNCISVLEDKFPDRVFFTPKKMGAQTAEANINAGLAAAKQIVGYLKEGDTSFKVN